jgi:pathogenesis-related protein 1
MLRLILPTRIFAPRQAVWFGALTFALGSIGCNLHDEGGVEGPSQGGSNGSSGSSNGTSGSGNGTPVQTDFPDAQIYVDAHNAVRAAVTEPSNYAGGTWQPLPPVSWSDEVATTSQQWANNLRDTRDCGLQHADGTGYGENLAAGSNVDAQRAVDMWANEKANYVYSPDYVFENDTGHYTQIVWRDSIRIGCASAACGRSSVVVCRYDPPGNYIGNEVF